MLNNAASITAGQRLGRQQRPGIPPIIKGPSSHPRGDGDGDNDDQPRGGHTFWFITFMLFLTVLAIGVWNRFGYLKLFH